MLPSVWNNKKKSSALTSLHLLHAAGGVFVLIDDSKVPVQYEWIYVASGGAILMTRIITGNLISLQLLDCMCPSNLEIWTKEASPMDKDLDNKSGPTTHHSRPELVFIHDQTWCTCRCQCKLSKPGCIILGLQVFLTA